jgi:predicted RNA methylase
MVKAKIEQAVNLLIKEDSNYSEIRQAAIDLKNLLTEITELDENNPLALLTIDTANGRATGTHGAAMCVIDYMRTRRFMQGVCAAVTEHLKTNASVKILYAGCGPFALQVLPLTILFKPSQVQIQCIELNTTTIDCFKKLISKLDIENYFEEVICADAAAIKLEQADEYDIIITETMLYALKNEAQVAITINLLNQCRKDAVLLPKEVQVNFACLTHDSSLTEKKIRSQSPLLHFNKQTAYQFSEWLQERRSVLFQKTVELNNDIYREGDKLAYFTIIHVYDNYSLQINESGLTVPLPISTEGKVKAGQAVKFEYRMGSRPGFVYEFI